MENIIAYIAGIVDGEGTISLHGANRKQRQTGSAFYYPFVQLANTNKTLIDWLDINIPIKHGIYGYHRNPDKQKPSWLIQFRGSYAVEFCRWVLPYLVGKKRQAEILLEYWEGAAAHNKSKRGYWNVNNPMPPEVAELRHKLYAECRKLNAKGPIKENVEDVINQIAV